jgi:chromosome condensin MukBEF MukE localization factor
MLSKEEQRVYENYLNDPVGKRLLKLLRQKSTSNIIDKNKPDPNAALYQAAQVALVKFLENLAGGKTDE